MTTTKLLLVLALLGAAWAVGPHQNGHPNPNRRMADGKLNTNEDEAQAFLSRYNAEYGVLLNRYVIASWNYETNLTDANAEILVRLFLSTQVWPKFETWRSLREKLGPRWALTATRPSLKHRSSIRQIFPSTRNVS